MRILSRPVRATLVVGLIVSTILPTQQGVAQTVSGDTQPGSKAVERSITGISTHRKLVVPDRVIYDMFIRHVGMEDDEFEQKKAAGEDTSKVRWDYKNMIGLSEYETTIMLSLVADGYHAMKAKDDEFNRLAQVERPKYIAAYTASKGTKPLPSADLRQTTEDEVALISTTMDNIKRPLGDASFSRLDGFIRRNWGPHDSVKACTGRGPTITTADSPPIKVQR